MTAAPALEIGDRFIYEGRPCLVCGFTPMSVEPARIFLTESGSGRIVSVSADELAARELENEAA